MLRPARFIDVPTLVDMLVEKHPESIYAPYGEVDRDYARKLLAQMVQRHGGVHNGGTCVFVVEDGREVICGFVVGALSPVYHIGTRLMAQDVFLVTRDGAPARTAFDLINAYEQWAEKNPRVIEIFLSRLDAFPHSERLDQVYERRGHTRCGAMFRRFVNLDQQKEAA